MDRGTKSLLGHFTVAHCAHHLCTGSLIPLLPMIRDAFSINYMEAGFLISAFSISYGIGQIPMALIADRISRRMVIILGLIGTALSALAVGMTTQYWQLIPGFIVMGILGGSYHAPASSFLSQSVPREKRGGALGFHMIGGSMGFLITPLLAIAIATWTGSWRWAFIILAIPAILSSVLIGIFTRERGAESLETPPSTQAPDSMTSEATQAFHQESISYWEIARAIGALSVVCLLIQLASSSVNSYLPMYLVDRHGMPLKMAGIVVGLVFGAGVVGAPLGGSLSDRLGRKVVIILSVVLAGPILYVATRTSAGILLLALLSAYGVVISMRMPTMESLIADVAPVSRRAFVLSVYYLMSQETAGIVTPLVGRLIDVYGLDPVFNGLAVGLCAAGAGTLLLWKYI